MSKTISCPNCGAKYKVPEDTKASRAKCKACGTVIDIQGQLQAGAAAIPGSGASKRPTPGPARPAPKAKPAPDAEKEKDVTLPVSARKRSPSREGIRRAAAKSSRSSRSRAKGGEETASAKGGSRARGARAAGGTRGARGGRGARGRREAPEEKSKTPMYLGIGGGVIAVAIAAFFLFKGSDNGPGATPKKGEQQQVAGNTEKARADGQKAANKVAKKDGGTSEAIAKKSDSETKKPAEASASKKPAAKKKVKKPVAKKKKKKPVYGESSTPFDAKSLDPVPFTDDTTEEEKADLKRWTRKMLEDSGFPGRKARDKIIKMGRKGVPALINALRELDYTTEDGTQTAGLINDGLSQIFLGINVGFNLVQGKPKDEVAWWNAKCVRTWIKQWNYIGGGDKEAFDRFIMARKKKMK